MLRALLLVVMSITACSTEVPTSEFEKVRKRVCACGPTDSACARGIVKEVTHLRELGSEPADLVAAKKALDEAAACAIKIEPALLQELDAAF